MALSEENSKYLTIHSTGLRRSGKVRNINGVEMSIWHADQVINFPLTVPENVTDALKRTKTLCVALRWATIPRRHPLQ
jgi:hypothetical protein